MRAAARRRRLLHPVRTRAPGKMGQGSLGFRGLRIKGQGRPLTPFGHSTPISILFFFFFAFVCARSSFLSMGFLYLLRAGATLYLPPGLLVGMASLVEHKLGLPRHVGFSRRTIEPVSPALAGGFLTTGPPGKSCSHLYNGNGACGYSSMPRPPQGLCPFPWTGRFFPRPSILRKCHLSSGQLFLGSPSKTASLSCTSPWLPLMPVIV